MNPKVKQEKLKPVASNTSPEEMLRLVEHHYPNLKGPLLVMVQMFDTMIDELDMLRRQLTQYQEQNEPEVTLIEEPDKPKIIELKCQHCGSEIEIEI